MDKHDLDREFPEFLTDLVDLQAHDNQFARLAGEYSEVDQKILSIEQNVTPASDVVAEDLKKLRVKLKDEIYTKLREHHSKA